MGPLHMLSDDQQLSLRSMGVTEVKPQGTLPEFTPKHTEILTALCSLLTIHIAPGIYF